MQITIIDAGNMARGIATRALLGGHTVRIIDCDPDKALHRLVPVRPYSPAERGAARRACPRSRRLPWTTGRGRRP